MIHDDVIKWKHFPRCCPFVRGIHRPPSQRPVTRSFDVFFDRYLNNRLRKQSWGWWFETPSCSLWRHSDVIGFYSDFLLSSSTRKYESQAIFRVGHELWHECVVVYYGTYSVITTNRMGLLKRPSLHDTYLPDIRPSASSSDRPPNIHTKSNNAYQNYCVWGHKVYWDLSAV